MIKRVQLATLLVVGEGPHEKAFLKHMKSIYDGDVGQKFTIDSADGGSPRTIIKTTVRKYRHTAFDRRYILLDSDVLISQQDRDFARKHKIELILSMPLCLDGMLLDILNEPIPSSSESCKSALRKILNGPPTKQSSYQKVFTRELLDQTTKEQIVLLRKLIANE